MKSVTVTVSRAPGNANSKRGRSWPAIKRERDRIDREVWLQLPLVREPGGPVLLTRPVRVRLLRRGWNRMDPLAVIESAKPVMDALVRHRAIVDDRHPYVTGEPVVTQEIVRDKRRPGWSSLVVTLEEME